MTSPAYCILSAGQVHCIPVTAFNSGPDSPSKLIRVPAVADHRDLVEPPLLLLLPTIMRLKHRNLLYTLNNPSLLDLESDPQNDSRFSANSQDENLSSTPSSPREPQTPSISTQRAKSPEEAEPPRTPSHISLSGIVPNNCYDGNILAILEDYSTHAIYLPQYLVDLKTNLDSDYTQIRELLGRVFPSWTLRIAVKQLTGGITNMLLSCTHESSGETLLMRVYGYGTNLIIDRHREFVSHLVLNSLKLAPPVHARFANGLIYGFISGRSLEPKELGHPYLYPLIAQRLGNWHNNINIEYIEEGVEKLRKYIAGLKKQFEVQPTPRWNKNHEKKKNKLITNLWELLDDWVSVVPVTEALVANFQKNLPSENVTSETVRDVILKELRWAKTTLNRTTKSSVVVSHCDLLSGNIIVPDDEDFTKNLQNGAVLKTLPPLLSNPIQLIDYEYMLPAPRAFDIANHFMEWQGFDCDRSAIPKPTVENAVMVEWCKGYLDDPNANEEAVAGLISEISCYYGLPGFYWGIWSMIQSEISNIDFNYAEYSEMRLEEYWVWKRAFLSGQPWSFT